jgi:predicted transcriptional regulator
MQVQLSEERQAQLNDYATRHGQDLSTALDEVLADALEWDRLEFEDTVRGIQQGLEDVKAGRTQPASEVFEELRAKYGLPR